MKIKIGYNHSEIQNVSSSVPHSSVLGPLLFLIFINLSDGVKLFVRPLSKETIKKNLNELSIWELRFNIEI